MNIFLLLRTAAGGLELVTPPLDSGTVLPGVTRQSVLDLAHNMSGIEVHPFLSMSSLSLGMPLLQLSLLRIFRIFMTLAHNKLSSPGYESVSVFAIGWYNLWTIITSGDSLF